MSEQRLSPDATAGSGVRLLSSRLTRRQLGMLGTGVLVARITGANKVEAGGGEGDLKCEKATTFQEALKAAAVVRRLEDLRVFLKEFIKPEYHGRLSGNLEEMDQDRLASLLMGVGGESIETRWHLSLAITDFDGMAIASYSDRDTFVFKKPGRLSRWKFYTSLLGNIDDVEDKENLARRLALGFYNLEDKNLSLIEATSAHPRYGRQERIPAIMAVGEYPLGSGRIVDIRVSSLGFTTALVTEEHYIDPNTQLKG